MKKFVCLTFILAIGFISLSCTANVPTGETTDASGAPAPIPADLNPMPEFDLEKIGGGTLKSDDLKGKVSVVDFWATWCAPCIQEIPNYNAITEKYADKDVVLLGITLQSGSKEEIEGKVKELNMKYPVVVGNDEVESGFGGLLGFPTTFIVTKDGKIYKKYLGLLKDKRKILENDIDRLLTE